MRRWSARLVGPDRDEGMTLVEILVAMFILAIVSAGVLQGLLQVLALTRDSRAREVAANLAAQEIDLARDTADVFNLLDDSYDIALNGDTFHVARSTQWVSDPGAEFTCGSSGGALRYKRVNVSVTWEHMRSAAGVDSSTVISPDEHINDPTKGTIIVSVLRADGTGAQGVTIGLSPSIASTIAPTDAQGCTYVLKVDPGTYTVSASRSGYVSSEQDANPDGEVVVVAGASASIGFQLDEAATFAATYAAGAPVVPVIAPGMATTFSNTYGRFATAPVTGAGTTSQNFRLHPYSSGYQAYAGSCGAADPTTWPEAPGPGGTLRGVLADPAAATPGGSATVNVPVGIVMVRSGGYNSQYLRAVPVDASCSASDTLSFGRVLTSGSGWNAIALPYGTWELYRGSNYSQTTRIGAGEITATTPAVPERTTIDAAGTVTLDPRVVVAP